MNPGLPEKYKEKGKLRIVKCKKCGHEYPTSLKIPRCSKCQTYSDLVYLGKKGLLYFCIVGEVIFENV